MTVGEAKKFLYELVLQYHPKDTIVWTKTGGVKPKSPCRTDISFGAGASYDADIFAGDYGTIAGFQVTNIRGWHEWLRTAV